VSGFKHQAVVPLEVIAVGLIPQSFVTLQNTRIPASSAIQNSTPRQVVIRWSAFSRLRGMPSTQGVKISVSRFELVADRSAFARVSASGV
jgi:hypothetical protein